MTVIITTVEQACGGEAHTVCTCSMSGKYACMHGRKAYKETGVYVYIRKSHLNQEGIRGCRGYSRESINDDVS